MTCAIMNRCLFFVLLLFAALPAGAYWQQHTATRIEVHLDDTHHILRAHEQIVYTNNSPDTLYSLYMHLWPNAYKNDRTAFCEQQVRNLNKTFYFSEESERGWIDSLHFSIDGTEVSYTGWNGYEDIAYIRLPRPLPPGRQLVLETPFRVKLPGVFSRLGHEGQAYFITQWFPKPAVYDHKGWHPMPYLDQGEFYSEFGSYDVRITLPQNYVLMATGNCVTSSEREFMDHLATQPLPADTMYMKSTPASSGVYKTVRYTEDRVHDFAWFADKRWILRTDTINPVYTDSIVTCYVAFLPQHQQQWTNALSYLKETVRFYGKHIGNYPYHSLKAVEGDMSAGSGSGMEYPTITVIDKSIANDLEEVIVHEAGHNWFYGILGSNERTYPWMDEGLNSFYEQKTLASIYKKDSVIPGTLEKGVFLLSSALREGRSVSLAADRYSAIGYGLDVYKKSALLFTWLEQEMGQDNFRNAMQDYYSQWQFRHPYPADFVDVFQAHSKQDLRWFFDGAMKAGKPVNTKISRIRRTRNGLQFRVRNQSGFPLPVNIRLQDHYASNDSVYHIPLLYKDTLMSIPVARSWKRIVIDANPLEQHFNDNIARHRTLFKRTDFSLLPFTGWNRTDRQPIYFSPVPAYNHYDRFGLGLLLHNVSLNPSAFQFALLPIFSFGSRQLNGLASASYTWFPERTWHSISTRLDIKSFSNASAGLNIPYKIYAAYLKISPSLEITFKEAFPMSARTRTFLLRPYWIREQFFEYRRDLSIDSLYRPYRKDTVSVFLALQYTHRNDRAFHPYSYRWNVELAEQFVKLSLTANARIDYDVPDKSFYIRAFAGKMFHFNSQPYAQYRYWWNTTSTGLNDYLYDDVFFARNENTGLFSRQVAMEDGAFKQVTSLLASPLGRSDNWLLTFNLKTDLPFGKLPLRWYVDIATFSGAKESLAGGSAFLFSSGLELYLFGELLSVYAPVFGSKDFNDYNRSMFTQNAFWQRISFCLNLRNFNGLKTPSLVFDKFAQNL